MRRGIYRVKDGDDVEIIISVDGSTHIKTPAEDRYRLIGTLHFERDTFVKPRPITKQHRKLSGVGFPYVLLKFMLLASESGHITVEVEGIGRAVIRSLEQLKRLPIKHWKGKGYERQVFIPLTMFQEARG